MFEIFQNIPFEPPVAHNNFHTISYEIVKGYQKDKMNASLNRREEENNRSGSSSSDIIQANVFTNRDSSYSFATLEDAINQAEEWCCTVMCKGYTITEPTILKDHNICQFIVPGGPDIDVQKTRINYSEMMCWMGSTFQFDYNMFHGAGDRHQIKKYILDACQRSGFKAEAEVKLVNPCATHPNPSKTATIRFRCCYNKVPLSQLPPKSGGM